jgi:hypothetical protein
MRHLSGCGLGEPFLRAKRRDGLPPVRAEEGRTKSSSHRDTRYPGWWRGMQRIHNSRALGVSNIMTVVQLFGAYVDTTLPREERSKALKTTYDFTCNCPECSRPTHSVDIRSAAVCPNRCGGLCAVEEGGVSVTGGP